MSIRFATAPSMATLLNRTLWLVRPEDVSEIEQRYLFLTRCERPDPSALRSADWIRFRRALACYLRRGGTPLLQPQPAQPQYSAAHDEDPLTLLVVDQDVMDLDTAAAEDEAQAERLCSGFTKRIGQDVLMMIISAYPEDGILEVDLFVHSVDPVVAAPPH